MEEPSGSTASPWRSPTSHRANVRRSAVAEGIGTHIDKGYIYFAMFFALVVEFLNIRLAVLRKRRRKPQKPAMD